MENNENGNAITEVVANFLGQVKDFTKEVQTYSKGMESKSKAFAIIEDLKFMVDDYVWVLDADQVHMHTGNLKIDKVHIAPRAVFGADGTDNRLQQTAKSLLNITQTHIRTVAYGFVTDTPYHYYRSGDKKQWWYGIGSTGWVSEDMISADSKEELLLRWTKKLENLRDAYYENYYKEREAERQMRIDEAKRTLEREGQR